MFPKRCVPHFGTEQKIIGFLAAHGLQINDIDLVITGRNGDLSNDEVYHKLDLLLFEGVSIANYKHLCGEYPTAASFALWMAANMVKKENIPQVTVGKEIK